MKYDVLSWRGKPGGMSLALTLNSSRPCSLYAYRMRCDAQEPTARPHRDTEG